MVKIFNKLFSALLVLVIIVLVVFLVLKSLNIINIYNVETGSMEDEIHSGDYVLLHKTNDYNVGDVVTYKFDDYFITHRIIKIEGEKVTTRGDANNIVDDEISISQIVGKVIYCGGILNYIINYRFVIAAFLIGLYLLSCYFESSKKIEE